MSRESEEMQPEYDTRGGTRGKYFERYASGGGSRRETRHDGSVSEPRQGPSKVIEGSYWIAPQQTQANGEHPLQSTVTIGVPPTATLPRIQVGRLDDQ